jgi:hypothetical protein
MAHQSAAVPRSDGHPSHVSKRPIDLVHLARQCLGDEGLEHEVLRLFDATIAAYASRLFAAQSSEEVALNLRLVRSAATGIGAWPIVDLAKAVENELRVDADISPERLGDLNMAIEEVREFIGTMLGTEAQ